MKAGAILHGVKYALKRGKSNAVPQIASITLPDGSTVAAVVFEGFTWEGDELIPVKSKFSALYDTTKHDIAKREDKP